MWHTTIRVIFRLTRVSPHLFVFSYKSNPISERNMKKKVQIVRRLSSSNSTRCLLNWPERYDFPYYDRIIKCKFDIYVVFFAHGMFA